MAPIPLPSAKITLSYPLYTCDFDPQDPNRLVVGGGGGPGRSGVGNKITLLDTSTQGEVENDGEIDLSRDEDSVSCLAVGQKRGRATATVFAGVNSSADSISKGKNEHFRVFAVDSSKTRPSDANLPRSKIAEISRHSFFSSTHNDLYQRVLRLGPENPSGGSQLCAVASGLGKEHEIAVLDVTATGPKLRARFDIPHQAEDVDIMQTGEDEYLVAFCTDYELHTIRVSKGSVEDSKLAFTTPLDVANGATARPTFRSIRFLTHTFILALANLPKRSGVALQGFRLPSPSKPDEKCRLAISERLPKNVAQATALAVRNLSPPSKPSPTARIGKAQFVVAVAGHDSSISLYTLEHHSVQTIDLLFDLLPLTQIKNVHPLQITSLAFSPFQPPKTTARPQFIKLGSTSLANTAVVHWIPLKRFVDRSVPLRKGGPPRPIRYVVDAPPRRPPLSIVLGAIAMIVLILAVFAQVYLESIGSQRSIFSTRPGSLRPTEALPNDILNGLFSGLQTQPGDKLILRDVITPDPEASSEPDAPAPLIEVDVLTAKADTAPDETKSWEELSSKQKELWRDRLKEAGHWAEDMGDSVFRGILFGELAGAVGRAVAG